MRKFSSFISQKGFLFKLGLFICAFWIFVVIFVPLIATHSTTAQDLSIRYQPPSFSHFFGTDELGRDVFSRVMYGSRISLSAGIITVIIAFSFGIFFGGIAGYKGGKVDEVMMRFSELIMAFPPLILAMVIAAALGPSIINSVIAMAIIWWPNYARLMRSMVISLKESEYVTASRVMGASHIRVLFLEILPNSFGPLLVMATLDLGNAILMFSGLSFLGLGTQPPTPEWGSMVSDGAKVIQNWWVSTFPGLAIFSISIGANFVGDGLRDFLDPKLQKE
ncbi:ABC transporter permease [Viridibacillus sp. FSL R5-0477]|uniref:Dipeptide/oligopeptide/nickel ABC transporter permease n=1 Tax=Viridibacillus arenosi FSL R5-213 TaxID=1227360 RepID=W4F0B3_9BACL|nr:ABC transporter permease [Viridibacillus arenosi]ETT86230.1 dipeptide/oligopeptide/nickel ABC transporter permease [Viridibacillus arenosi FSL R5-213]OMC91915.1 D-ala-D-ala transporter subunit [Viridibacillus arenosi]